MAAKKKVPEVDVLLNSLIRSGVIKAGTTLQELVKGTKPLHGLGPDWGMLFDTDHFFCVWPKKVPTAER